MSTTTLILNERQTEALGRAIAAYTRSAGATAKELANKRGPKTGADVAAIQMLSSDVVRMAQIARKLEA